MFEAFLDNNDDVVIFDRLKLRGKLFLPELTHASIMVMRVKV